MSNKNIKKIKLKKVKPFSDQELDKQTKDDEFHNLIKFSYYWLLLSKA